MAGGWGPHGWWVGPSWLVGGVLLISTCLAKWQFQYQLLFVKVKVKVTMTAAVTVLHLVVMTAAMMTAMEQSLIPSPVMSIWESNQTVLL